MARPGVAILLTLSICLAGAGCQDVTVRRSWRGPTVAVAPAPPAAPETGRVKALAESGRPGGSESKDEAAREQLAALTDAFTDLTGSDDPEARSRYAAALAEFLRITGGRRMRLDETWRDGLAALGVTVTDLREGPVWEPEGFDEFLLADGFRVRGLVNRHGADGVGVPLIAVRKFRWKDLEDRKGPDKFLMPRQVYPATAVLRPLPTPNGGAAPTRAYRLEVLDPLRSDRVEVGSRSEPLATDLTTPLAFHFARSPLPVLQEVGLLDPQWLEKLAGLYMLHPYEPGKVPVVLVHGLRSSPVAWMKVLNELQGDPAVRSRYQFWLFMYPTGTPFPYSAAKLRGALDEVREAVDPGRADRALDRTVLVGHSMGGLISKMMILGSGDALWNLVGAKPFDSLQATPEHRDLLRQVFFFEPHPSVRRVVFIATPHRGSELGDQFIGRLADRLIRLPNPLRATYRALLAQNGPDFFTPAVRGGLPSSIDELRTDNPLLMTLARLPVGPGVVCHSVIGRKDPEVPVERSSDGVVPYTSAHLDWAASERVVPGDHGCQGAPETIEELRRILTLHAAQAAREGGELPGPPEPGAEPAPVGPTVREATGPRSPAERLNGRRYHPE